MATALDSHATATETMSLTRADLENGLMQQLFSACREGPRCLSDEELDASIRCTLSGHAPHEDVWVFGYGSLIWNPIFHHLERRTATLRGYHRRFCLWSMMGRGTPENPGLVLGLDRGGVCRGVVYRIAAHHAVEELRLLWRREMVVGSYCPRWLRVDAPRHGSARGVTEEVRALAFVVNREHANYAGRLPDERVAHALATARGHIGASAEYLLKTFEGLAAHGIHDRHLAGLCDRVLARES
jgi:cation transport protein ChaC